MTAKSALGWRLTHLFRTLWFRVTLYALVAGIIAIAALALKPFVPDDFEFFVDTTAVDSILNVLASSMLAVSTFSLGIMVSAIAAASSNATPRASQLLIDDDTSQNVIATFLGAFVFSLVGLLTVKMGLYGAAGRVLLLIATIGVLILIFWNFVRWIDVLRVFGRFSDLLPRVEDAATEALTERVESPYLGCRPMRAPPPPLATTVAPPKAGYVLHVDLPRIETAAAEVNGEVWLPNIPGAYVFLAEPLAHIVCDGAEARETLAEEVQKSFTIADQRTFEQDPRFGLIVLAEIASRALSPAINDPGTAIDVLTRGARILALWRERADAKVEHPHLYFQPLKLADLFEDLFRPVARDGAGIVEVQVWLQKNLLALIDIDEEIFAAPALKQSAEALQRAEATLTLESEKEDVRALAQEIAQHAENFKPPTI
jgi:uncharacterized membrane protein